MAAVRTYIPKPYGGQIDLFITADKWHKPHLWRPFARNLREHYLQRFEVNDLLLGPHADILAGALQGRLDQIWNGKTTTIAPALQGAVNPAPEAAR